MNDPDLELFAAGQRAATRRRLAIAAISIAAVVISGVAAVTLLKRSPCEQVAERLCAYVAGVECDAFRRGLPNLPVDRCVQALEGLDAVDAMPAFVRAPALTHVLEELVGMTPESMAAAEALAGPMAELDRTGKLSDKAVEALLAAPSAACLQIIGKMNMGQDYAQQPLHEVLVKMNGGKDLGAAGTDWLDWCRARMPAR